MVITEGRIAHRKVVVPQVCIKILLNHNVYFSSLKKISRSPFDIPVVGSHGIVYSVTCNAEVYDLWRQAAAERRKHQRRIIRTRVERYVCVSCVSIHVSRRRTPASQSLRPCSESSWNLGGIEMLATGAVIAAPSISRPGKKQTR